MRNSYTVVAPSFALCSTLTWVPSLRECSRIFPALRSNKWILSTKTLASAAPSCRDTKGSRLVLHGAIQVADARQNFIQHVPHVSFSGFRRLSAFLRGEALQVRFE